MKNTLVLPNHFEQLLSAHTESGIENAAAPPGSVTLFEIEDKRIYFIAADHKVVGKNAACAILPEIIEQLTPECFVVEVKTGGQLVPPRLISAANEQAQTGFTKADEALYTIHLAHSNSPSIPVIGGEPPDETIFDKLKDRAKDVAAFYILRQIAAIIERHGNPDKARIERRDDAYITEITRLSKVPAQYQFTFDGIETWLAENVGKAKKIAELGNMDFAPLPNGTSLQKLSYEMGIIRDIHALEVLTRSLNEYGTVGVVYGLGHLAAWRPVLEKMFRSKGQVLDLTPAIPPRGTPEGKIGEIDSPR